VPARGACRQDTITTAKNKVIQHHGLTVLKPTHRAIRQLKRQHAVSVYGNRTWETSWLLIDFIKQQHLSEGLKILEIGCGWGLVGIFCAKYKKARVICLDADREVFPYLRLHAETNGVQVGTWNICLEDLTVEDLAGVDVLVGGEICFWDSLAEKLTALTERALLAGVRLILIADPGRSSFDRFEAHCLEVHHALTINWRIYRPYIFQGRILKILP
jgi:predicted nicotinamide N-methyase